MPIGDRIKYYREQAGMTMEQLAQAVGVQNSAINKYEKGLVTNMPINRNRQIEDALGIDVRLVLDFLDEPSSEVDEMREELRANPDLRMLLSASRNLNAEDIRQLVALAERMNRE